MPSSTSLYGERPRLSIKAMPVCEESAGGRMRRPKRVKSDAPRPWARIEYWRRGSRLRMRKKTDLPAGEEE